MTIPELKSFCEAKKLTFYEVQHASIIGGEPGWLSYTAQGPIKGYKQTQLDVRPYGRYNKLRVRFITISLPNPPLDQPEISVTTEDLDNLRVIDNQLCTIKTFTNL